jgi:hypothetical protein
MIQILEDNSPLTQRMKALSDFSQSLGGGAETLKGHLDEKSDREILSKKFDTVFKDIKDPNLRNALLQGEIQKQVELEKSRLKEERGKQLFSQYQDLLRGSSSSGENLKGEMPKESSFGDQVTKQQISASEIPDELIHMMSLNPETKSLADSLRQTKDVALRESREERAYHTQFSKPIEENVAKLRDAIPKKEAALNLARNAIETGDLSFFSPDKLADFTGLDLFRTAKGAQLITAGKENLLGNMSRASARAQNMWFEQRLNSMFPKIGQSEEANLTTAEMIEGELALDKLYQEEFDRMSAKDEQDLGYVRKDIDRRVRDEIKPREKQIFNRTMYRLRELEEQEMGTSKLQSQIGKNVAKGTPLTLAMAKLYKDKFGDKALAVAKKNGYYIPTLDEFKMFRSEPQEFREELIQ